MNCSLRDRTPVFLPGSFRKRLNAYAVAASAAGVGLLASSPPAEAEIVYTPAHHVILRGSTLNLDLNHDNIPDFRIVHLPSFCTTDGFCTTRFYATGAAQGNYVAGAQQGFDFAYALKAGSKIGPGDQLLGHAMYYRFRSVNSYGHCTGPWAHAKQRYLGFKFLIHGETHYGWARLNVACTLSNRIGVLTGYAYETIPNKPIMAGKTQGSKETVEPATLGRLALGRK